MNVILILYPMITLVALTMIIWGVMLKRRTQEVINNRINLKKLSTRAESNSILKDVAAAENFSNLLEVPIFFYLLCLCLYVTNLVSYVQVIIAWGYVIIRTLHSVIHVTNNHVKYRFYAYATSTISLFVMWSIFSFQIITLEH